MIKESEVEKTARFTRHFLKGILVLFLVIVIIIGAYVGIGAYWAWHQEQVTNQDIQNLQNWANSLKQSTPTPTQTPASTPSTPSPTPMGFMGSAEQASITNVCFVTVGSTVVMNATVINTGTNAVTIASATIDGNTATLAYTGSSTSYVIDKSDTGYFTITPIGGSFADGAQYTINLLTAEGNTLSYTATYSVQPSL